MGEEGIATRHVGQKLLIEERRLHIVVHIVEAHQDGGIELAPVEGTLDVGSLHLHHADVGLGVLALQAGEEPGQQIWGYGGQDAQTESACQRVALFVHDVVDAVGSHQHLPCLLYHFAAYLGGNHLLRRAFKYLHAQFGFQLLYHGAQRGLGDPTMLGGTGEMAKPIYRHNIFHLL